VIQYLVQHMGTPPFLFFEEGFAAFVEVGKIMFTLDNVPLARGTRIFQPGSISVAMGPLTGT